MTIYSLDGLLFLFETSLLFHVWLTSLNMIISMSIHVAANGIISLFSWLIFHHIYVLHLLYPFICWWTFRLFLCVGYGKQCCNAQWGACVFSNYDFLWIHAQELDCRIIWHMFSCYFIDNFTCLRLISLHRLQAVSAEGIIFQRR